MKFYKNEFLEYMENNFTIDNLTKDLIESIIKYGEKHQNVTKNQIVYFIYDILSEIYYIKYEEIAQFYK